MMKLAIIDGASPLRCISGLFSAAQPVTITALMHCVMTIWNDFGISLYLLNSQRTTAVLTTHLFMGQKASDWQLLFADVVLWCPMPIVILYLCMQKYIVAGLSDGAVKG